MQNEVSHDFLEEHKQEQLPVVLTAAEAMDVLGVGKNTMYRLLNSGTIQAFRIGRCWKIPISFIDELKVYHS